jgi:regulator of sigma E protease
MGILVAILLLSIVIIIHELGHFTVAKLVGIKVHEFALFMGPKIFGVRLGETLYSLRAIPLGGFVKMEGEEEASEDDRAFNKKPVWARAAVVFMGPLMNILLALVLFSVNPMLSSGNYSTNVIDTVVSGYPAEKAGLQPGDRIIRVDGEHIWVYEQISYILNTKKDQDIDFEVLRNGQRLYFTVKPIPEMVTADGTEMKLYRVGFVRRDGKDFAGFFKYGFNESIWTTKMIFTGLEQLVTGKISAENLSGPIGIVSFISEQASQTTPAGTSRPVSDILLNLMYTAAFLSINLGVFNLLPIPALDGSKLVILAVERIRRKPIPPEKEAMITMVGFFFLIGLMLFATFNDILRIGK